MVGKIIERYEGILYPHPALNLDNMTLPMTNNSMYLSHNVIEAKIMIATSLCFLAGTIHVL